MNEQPPEPAARLWRRLRLQTSVSWAVRYALAVLAVTLAFDVRLVLTEWVGPGLPTYITFYPAIMVAALAGGLGPALVATGLASLATAYWILPPVGQIAIASPVDRLGLAIFSGMGLFMGVVAELYRRRRHKAAAYDRAQALLEGDERFRNMFDRHHAVMMVVEPETGAIVDANPSAALYYGYSREQLRAMRIQDINQLSPDAVAAERAMAVAEQRNYFVFPHRLASGKVRWVEVYSTPFETRGRPLLYSIIHDITARKRSEEQLREVTQRLTYHVDNSPLAVIEWGPDMRLTRWAGAAERVFGWKAEEVLGKRMEEIRWVYHEDEAQVAEVSGDLTTGADSHRFSANRNYRKDGSVVYCEWYNSSLLDESGKLRSILSLVLDVTERKRTEDDLRASREAALNLMEDSVEARREAEQASADLRKSEERLALAASGTQIGMFDRDFVTGEISATEQLIRLIGLRPTTTTTTTTTLSQTYTYREWAERVHPEDLLRIEAELARCLNERAPFETDYRVIWPDGDLHWVSVRGVFQYDAQGQPLHLLGIIMEITARKQAEAALREAAEDLVRSNKDLEQFAYVCSHDLKEPLRMVTGFTSLLKERYGDRLDAKAGEYINYASEAATRMQGLVDDLLAYSRAGREKMNEPVDATAALTTALKNLRAALEDSGAAVTHDPLPTVRANPLELAQVFQNLIGNAIKFRKAGVTAEIHVGVRRVEAELVPDHWLFSVRDNGIGIDPQFADRIFMIFQRLYTREEYPGSGVGLAICKKIVERCGGKIWVESEPGKGSTFYFTLSAESQ